MTDTEFLASFEACTLDEFHHRDHVRAAWCYLQKFPVLEAVDRFTAAIKRFAESKGQSQLYHETITWAFLFLVHERIGANGTWDDFARRNPDLLSWKPSLLNRYYRPETLASDRARHTFILPDGALD
jgi:hypothetical protein